MYLQRETFDIEGDNLSSLLPCPTKCDTITYNKSQLYEKYYAIYQQRKAQLRKSKRGSSTSLPQSKQSSTNQAKDKERSRSRSRSPKSERRTAGGKKAKTSQTQLDSEKESQKKPAQKSKPQTQSQVASKAPSTKGKKEDEVTKPNQHPQQGGKAKVAGSSFVAQQNDSKNNKSKQSTVQQSSGSQQKNDLPSNNNASQQKKGAGKKGKNDEDSNNLLLENQDNWRRIQKVMQTYDYREKPNQNNNNNVNVEEQKQADEAFKTPFHILEELNKTLPKRATIETSTKNDNQITDKEKKYGIDQIDESKQLAGNNYDECSSSEVRESSSNMMQMIELDSTVLDQDKIIEEQKQSELQINYTSNIQTSSKSKLFVVPIPKGDTNQSNLNSNKDAMEEEIDNEPNSKKLSAKQNKLSDDDKQHIYKKFIMEYVKLNRSKLHGPQSLYIIHPEMMQVMQIQAALPQRKWKKEIAHYFVQKECLNPIQKEVQIKKCINQRIIDIFQDKNIPSNIPSKNFYKLFKTHFLIKVYDNTKQLSDYEENPENNEAVEDEKKEINQPQQPIDNITLEQTQILENTTKDAIEQQLNISENNESIEKNVESGSNEGVEKGTTIENQNDQGEQQQQQLQQEQQNQEQEQQQQENKQDVEDQNKEKEIQNIEQIEKQNESTTTASIAPATISAVQLNDNQNSNQEQSQSQCNNNKNNDDSQMQIENDGDKIDSAPAVIIDSSQVEMQIEEEQKPQLQSQQPEPIIEKPSSPLPLPVVEQVQQETEKSETLAETNENQSAATEETTNQNEPSQ